MDNTTKRNMFPPDYALTGPDAVRVPIADLPAQPELEAHAELDADPPVFAPAPADSGVSHGNPAESPPPSHLDQTASHAVDAGAGEPRSAPAEMTYATRLSPDHPGLKLDKPQGRALRRGPILAIAAVVTTVLVLAVASAFAPKGDQAHAATPNLPDEPQTKNVPISDTIQNAPTSNDDLHPPPKLGPPLHGAEPTDTQNGARTRAGGGFGQPSVRQALRDEREKAFASPILVDVENPSADSVQPTLGAGAAALASALGSPTSKSEQVGPAPIGGAGTGDPNMQQHKSDFLSREGVPTPKASLSQPLSNDERNVYNLIARRYLAQFYPPQEFYQLEAELHVAGERFIAKGRQPIAPGWRRLYDSPADREDLDDKDPDAPPQDEDVDPGSPIPPLKPGQILRVARTRTVDKKTKPPRRFTAATLVQAMTRIARYVTNAQIKALLRESDGIGTPATQARIIQLLFDRGYVEEKKRLVYSTATGRALIKALPPVTTQPDMTALWESTLRKVQEGHAPLEGFLHAVRAQLGELVARAKSAGPLDLPGAETRPCRAPRCTGSLCKRSGKKGAFWACSRYPDCRETASTESSAGASGRRGGTRKCRR